MERPVLARGIEIDSYTKINRIVVKEDNWQIYHTNSNGYFLIVYEENLIRQWDKTGLFPSTMFFPFKTATGTFKCLLSDYGNRIASVKEGPFPDTFEQAYAFAVAIRETRKIDTSSSFRNGIYLEQYSRILPSSENVDYSDNAVLGHYLTGGVEISTDQFDTLCKVDSWMKPGAVAEIIKTAGLNAPEVLQNSKQAVKSHVAKPASPAFAPAKNVQKRFSLPGRPKLEEFFNEHIIDIVLNEEKYARMGVDFPSAVILHGSPGCGKTYAVSKLVDFLGWQYYEINSGSIGSPYIHDTSKKISEVFDRAIDNAPSVIIIDEMEAFLTDRNTAASSGQHHVEEVAEFLRRIPEAISKKVLIIAMTNMIEKIDPAILRRGRFDNIVAIDMPTKEEVAMLIHAELKKLPVSDDVLIEEAAQELEGRAMSDVTFVLKEAGRNAVRKNKECIDMADIKAAINTLPTKQNETRKIGF